MSTYQVRTLEEADQIIKEYERKTKTLYILLQSTKNFGCVDIPDCANEENEVRFETVGVPYCGAPFYVAGIKILQCQSSKGRGTKRKRDNKSNVSSTDAISVPSVIEVHSPKQKVKKRKTNGRAHHTLGCTATVIMKEVIYYPEFQMYHHSKNNKIAVARHLKEILKSKAQVQKDRIIYITVPGPKDHFGHTLAASNVGNPSKNNVKRLYVKNDFFGHNEPGNSRRVYYPVKQENKQSQMTKKLKVDGDDYDVNAKEVREVLQSIMALTYKPGSYSAYQELLKDLNEAHQKYKESIDSVFYSNEESLGNASSIRPTDSTSNETSIKDTGWDGSISDSTAAQLIPGTATVVSVTSLPMNNSNTGTATPNSVESTSHQETSIFLEAMEAIFNPQI